MGGACPGFFNPQISQITQIILNEVQYKRRRWPRASSQIEIETLKKRISNIE
jgi:hypothetical protein